MRVKFDYDDRFMAFPKKTQEYIKKNILLPFAKTMENTIKIKRVKGDLKLDARCFSWSLSKTTWTGADLVMLISMEARSDVPYIAKSAACQVDNGSFRPNAGVIVLNLDYIAKTPDHKALVTNHLILFHETTHTLGFSP